VAKAQSKKPVKAEWKGFHNVNLTREDEPLFEAWQQDNVVGINWLEAWADNGYKVSVDFDPYNEGFKASLYCTQAKMEWAGYTLTAWAGDVQTALNLLAFKHYVMCNQKWEIAKDTQKRGTSNYG
jgi:hypothetical protein